MKAWATDVTDDKLSTGYLVTVEFEPTWFERVFQRLKKEKKIFCGSGTVFRDVDSGKRPPGWFERQLAGKVWLFKRTKGFNSDNV